MNYNALELRNLIKERMKRKKLFSQREAAQLGIALFEQDYKGEQSEESFAYHRGIVRGINIILGITDELIKEENDKS